METAPCFSKEMSAFSRKEAMLTELQGVGYGEIVSFDLSTSLMTLQRRETDGLH